MEYFLSTVVILFVFGPCISASFLKKGNGMIIGQLRDKLNQTKDSEKYEARLDVFRTEIAKPASSNPMADFWKGLGKLIKKPDTGVTNLRTVIQQVDNIVTPAYFLAFQDLAQIFNDEGINLMRQDGKAKAVGKHLTKCSRILEIIRNGTNAMLLISEPSAEASALQDAIFSGIQMTSVLEILSAVFHITQEPTALPLLYQVTPILEELAKPAYLAAEKLASSEIQPIVDEITAAYFTCFGPYRLPFYKRTVVVYGVTMGVVFSALMALILWIMLRRPSFDKPPADIKKTH
jgi:hypothetical protein